MKIGILTFHWATNYGAVLQAYCLQEYLLSLGHNVDIINYKPKMHDLSIWNIIRHPSNYRMLLKFFTLKKKESLLDQFRNRYLHVSRRYYSIEELQRDCTGYDVLVSGSDQVLNASFTRFGEGKPTSAYYLNFGGEKTKRIGYAVSFGCTKYPDYALEYAKKWIQCFNSIGYRENNGDEILKELGFKKDHSLVPDPVLLYGTNAITHFFETNNNSADKYRCIYLLRGEKSPFIPEPSDIVIDDTHDPISLEEWVETIACASLVITNSYHGMLVSIINHVPFVVVINDNAGNSMKDRFFTILDLLGLSDRIYTTENEGILSNDIDWRVIDKKLSQYRDRGVQYIEKAFSE